MYKTKAIQLIQNGRVFYSVAIPAAKLVELVKVDIWDPNNPTTGYQRMPSESRKRAIGQYAIKPDSIMPIGGLLNARDTDETETKNYGKKLKFIEEHKEGFISFGTLIIPDDALPLYIVDMQHRIGGYEWAMQQDNGEKLEDFPLIVTIADGLSRSEEIDQFDIINTTQKKIRTDLARRLKSIQIADYSHRVSIEKRGELWEAKGATISEILNKTNGPWLGKILPPNKSKAHQSTMIIRETSFVSSLKPILQTPYFISKSEEVIAELINRYWSAIQKVWPEAFENSTAYVIQKTTGVFALHEIGPEVFELAHNYGGLTFNEIFEIVQCFSKIGGADFWIANIKINKSGAASYGGMKGFNALALELKQYLPKN